MSYDFTGGTTAPGAFTVPTTITDPPFTLAAWVNSDEVALESPIITLCDQSAVEIHSLNFRFTSRGEGSAGSYSSGWAHSLGVVDDMVADTWYLLVGIWASTTSRKLRTYNADGSLIRAATENTTEKAPTGIDLLTVGCQWVSGSRSNGFNGRIGQCAAWSAALTAEQADSLATSIVMYKVAPQSCQFYAAFAGTEQDYFSAVMTTSGSPGSRSATHPRVIGPSTQILQFPSAASGVTITDVDGDEAWNDADAGLVIVGTGFL